MPKSIIKNGSNPIQRVVPGLDISVGKDRSRFTIGAELVPTGTGVASAWGVGIAVGVGVDANVAEGISSRVICV